MISESTHLLFSLMKINCMKKTLLFLFALTFSGLFAINKDEKIKYQDTAVKVEDMRIRTNDAVSTDAYIKAKFIFENKNDYFVFLDPNKSFYFINGVKYYNKDRELVIPPNGKKSKVLDVKGRGLNVPAVSLVIEGLSKTGNERMVGMPDLTAARKQVISSGNVEVMVVGFDFDAAKRCHVKMKVTNTGHDVLMVNAGVIELSEEGNTLNNIGKRTNSIMLRKGQSEVILGVYQVANVKGEKKLIWNDAFVSASLMAMDPVEIGMAVTSDYLKNFKFYLTPKPPVEIKPADKKEEPIAMNTDRSQKATKEKTKPEPKSKPEPKQPVTKEKAEIAKEKTEVTPKDKTEVKQPEKKRAEAIQSEGEMAELHAAEVNFSDAGGKYYALLIGSSDYKDPAIPDLEGLPVNDAIALEKVLKTNYTFAPENINVLKNPTRREIVIALDDLSKKVTNNDNVLIFYAGHGHYEDENDIGYWLPTDAEVSNSSNWLYNDQLVASIRKIKSLHTLLISDACFSGSIFKNRSISLTGASDVIKKKYQLPSRKAITSGTLKTVPNKSVFIKYLLDRLEKNKDKYFAASSLYRNIEEPVGNNSTSLPQYGVINNVGDEGGDFIFIRK